MRSCRLRKNQRVLLVDCDTITGHIASSLGMERLRTLSQAWNEQAVNGGDTEGLAQIAAVHSSGLSVLVLSSSPLHTEILEPIRVASAVADARKSYDWIILDMHPDYGPLNQNLFALADRILVPVTPDVPCIRAARPVPRGRGRSGHPRPDGAHHQPGQERGVLRRRRDGSSGVAALARVRSAGMLFVKAADQGRSAVEVSPASKVVGDLDLLGEQLMNSINGVETRGPRRGGGFRDRSGTSSTGSRRRPSAGDGQVGGFRVALRGAGEIGSERPEICPAVRPSRSSSADLALLELSGLKRHQQQPLALGFVGIEQHLDERGLDVLALFVGLGRLAVEDQVHPPTRKRDDCHARNHGRAETGPVYPVRTAGDRQKDSGGAARRHPQPRSGPSGPTLVRS